MTPTPGASHFKWNAGWFGAQIGGSCWMFVEAVRLAARSEWRAAIVYTACCALCNAVGTWIWRHRTALPVYSALQIMILVLGLTSAVCMSTTEANGTPQAWGRNEIRLLLMFPVLGLFFAYLQRSSRKQSAAVRDANTPRAD